MTPILLVVAVVVVIVAFFFLRKKPEPELPAAQTPAKLPEKTREEKAPAKAQEKPAEKKPEKAPEKPAAQKPPPPPPATAKDAKPAATKSADRDEVPIKVEAPREASVPPSARASREPAPTSARKRDVEGLRKGLTKAREKEGFFGRLKALFVGKKEIDPDIVEQIEEVLLTSDVGVKTTEALLSEIRRGLERNELADSAKVWQALREHASRVLEIGGGGGLQLTAHPTVVMVVGVNGVGKTTTIGKLATKLKAEGKKVVLAAGDTFRAAAVQQLIVWGKRVNCDVVSGKDGANPGAVIFDAIQKAKEIGADVVLADTAGRLHTKTNLMEELTRVAKTMGKAFEGAPHETLLVLDATNGQNALQQAAMFKEALPLTGIVLTKLDGTAKGGVILGICDEHQLPVRYIGIGERAEDLRDFVADEFVEAMLGQTDDADAAA